eukprot:7846085-Alexandrium_andersonii.AAC.1
MRHAPHPSITPASRDFYHAPDPQALTPRPILQSPGKELARAVRLLGKLFNRQILLRQLFPPLLAHASSGDGNFWPGRTATHPGLARARQMPEGSRGSLPG